MLEENSAAPLYDSILALLESDTNNPRKDLFALRPILRELLGQQTAGELQFFSTPFAQWSYICDKYAVPAGLSAEINAFRRFTARLAKDRDLSCTREDVLAVAKSIAELIFFFSAIDIPSELTEYFLNVHALHTSSIHTADTLDLIRVIVKSWSEIEQHNDRKRVILHCEAEDFGSVKIALYDRHTEIASLVWAGATLHITELLRAKNTPSGFYSTGATLIVIEPDILIDVTDVAECFQQNGANPLLYFLKKFSSGDTSYAAFSGTLVNNCFDELLHNPDADFEKIFRSALAVKPLQTLYALGENSTALADLFGSVREQFNALSALLPTLHYDNFSIEPTFISPLYGLQGRLDLLLEYDDRKRKTVIELKSGKPPAATLTFTMPGRPSVQTGMWINHLIQTTCYNLLLDSAFKGRTGDSQVLYSRASDFPLRNAPNIYQNKQDALMLRNRIIAIEHEIIERKFSFLKNISLEKFGVRPDFKQDEVKEFSNFYGTLSPLERTYFQAYFSFLMREQYAGRTGTEGNRASNGFASLWRDSLEEKEQSFAVLAHLELLPDESDFSKFYLTFLRTEKTAQVSSFRIGDIAILYPLGNESPVEGQIIKASIRGLSPERITISLRNKQIHREFFTETKTWAIEGDQIESGFITLYRSLVTALKSPLHKREILLGLRAPEFADFPELDIPNLHPEQKNLLARALAAKDYFLLQGPPGTGKTSMMLRNLVEYLFNKTDETLLVLAFTNRAVDEICFALKRISHDFPFLRLGGKETTEHPDKLLSVIAHEISIEELKMLLDQTRIIVSTVSSVNSNPEILKLKRFTTAIIDEASQLLEPQIIGILAAVDRFILIGDEKQLPAVVVQSERGAAVRSEQLSAIHLADLRISLFERLLRCCTANGWDGFGMLTRQARMHHDIQRFPSKMFYDRRLEPMNDRQYSEHIKPDSPVRPVDGEGEMNSYSLPLGILEKLNTKRMIYIPSNREHRPKVHRGEAEIAAAIITHIAAWYGDEFSASTLGVITPFRAQIAEIYTLLPPELRSIVTIDTVERFQGSERDIIILSCAVSHAAQFRSAQSLVEIGETLIDRKLNVALTRAREQFILLGCEEVLRESVLYRGLLEDIAGE